MPNIQLTDQFGLNVDAAAAPASALLKYFQQLPSLRFDTLDLTKVGGLTLDEPSIRSFTTGLSFQQPVNLGEGAPAFCVAAGAQASIALISDAHDLPGDGATDDTNTSCYVSFGIEATASATLKDTAGSLQFGAAPSTKLDAVSYTRFALKAGTTLLQAVEQTVGNFALPACCRDLEDLPAGQIAKVGVSGKLTLSGAVNLLAITNPLASAALPAPLPALSVSAGGSATVGVSWEMDTDFEIVARKLNNGVVRLSWAHKNGAGVTVSASVSESVSADVGTTDVFGAVVSAISADPKADLQELQNAGVSHDMAADIQAAVKAAICRKLEIAIGGEVTTGDSLGSTFVFEIVPSALTDQSRQAIDQALRGDLTALHATELPGVSCVRSVWDNVTKVGVDLEVNLLGILNYRSLATLAVEGKVLYEPVTGALVITDAATAKRIQSTQLNFGADTGKLLRVLAESFLITAAYRAADPAAGASLKCSHSFFDLQNTTSFGDMARKLRTGVALGLFQAAEPDLPKGAAGFGRTLFSVSTDYDDTLVRQMFLDSKGTPVPHEWYETVGRNAIQFLVQPEDDDAVRRQPATDDELWSRMKEVGQTGFANLFPLAAAPLVGAITADYSTIQWWADAMQSTGQKLAAMRQWLTVNSTATLQDPAYEKLRQDLAAHLRQVAENTSDEFGQPWGLISMNLLVSGKAGASILITGPTLVLKKSRAMVASAGS